MVAENEENKTVADEPLPSMIDKAMEAAEALKAANAEKKILLDREEKLKATEMLGGTSEAGTPIVPVNPEQKAADARVKAIGMATGAAWAKKMDDGKTD